MYTQAPGPQFAFTLPPVERWPQGRRANRALWLIGLGLVANAAIMLFGRGGVPEIVLDRSALGQSTPAGSMLGARGIYMMPAQISPNEYGLYLMDVDSSTICVYKVNPATSHFKLMAARSFKYDRFFEDFNNEAPKPRDVQKIVEDQRQRTDLHMKDDLPTVDQTSKPDENKPDTPKEAGK